MSTVWSPSKVETRTAWLEERGTGACSGRECRLARERRPRERTPPSLTGTHTTHQLVKLTSVLFVSPPPPPPRVAPVSVCVFFLALLSSPSCTPLLSTYAVCVALCVRTVCTVPLIDSVHGETFTFESQGGGDSNGFARGAWDWSMLWKRIPLGAREHKLRKTQTEPYRYTQSFLTL